MHCRSKVDIITWCTTALQVASEDTVLYTAQQYVVRCTRFGFEQRAHAQRLLAPLIRCPHLSHYWLAGSADSDQALGRVLSELRPHLRRLLKLLDAQPSYIVEGTDLQRGACCLVHHPAGLWGAGSTSQ